MQKYTVKNFSELISLDNSCKNMAIFKFTYYFKRLLLLLLIFNVIDLNF
jgi:hypothetical protein